MKKVTFAGFLMLFCSLLWAAENQRHEMTVYKTPWCGCCSKWADYMGENGFSITAVEVEDIDVYKNQFGVPADLSSCHTALVEGYFIEGHVPAADVISLLRDKPEIIGLTVPGMPIGSPGMEVGTRVQAYSVLAVRKDGSSYTYNQYEGRE
jgi:hypothetical protein